MATQPSAKICLRLWVSTRSHPCYYYPGVIQMLFYCKLLHHFRYLKAQFFHNLKGYSPHQSVKDFHEQCVLRSKYICIYMDVSENNDTPKSSIFIGFSIINHPFWGTTIFGNTHIVSIVILFLHVFCCYLWGILGLLGGTCGVIGCFCVSVWIPPWFWGQHFGGEIG